MDTTQVHNIQKQDLRELGSPNVKAFVGEGDMEVHVSSTIAINLYPSQCEFLLGFEKEKVSTTDKIIIMGFGEIKIQGIIILWAKLETFYGRPTLTKFRVEGATKTQWYLVDLDCRIILGRKTMHELNLNIKFPFEYHLNQQYTNWQLMKRPNKTWTLKGFITRINPSEVNGHNA